nr:hypothetical protein [Tanacetum cinerariifolium]
MSSAFADTHNMVAILTKSEASEGFNQIIDFLNDSFIKYALTSISVKRTSWNEFSLAMASAVICLSTGRKFNFSKYSFDSLNRLGDLSTHTTKYISSAITQKVFANMRRVGKGCSGVETPLFAGMLVAGEPGEQDDEDEQAQGNDNDAAQEDDIALSGDDVQDQSIPSHTPPPQPQDLPSTSQEALNACAALTRRVEHLEHDKVAQDLEITKLKTRVKKLERANKGRMIDELDRDEGVALMGEKKEEKKAEEVLSMQEDEPEVQEVVEVVTTAKLITEVVTAASTPVIAAASTRRRRGVVIKDPEKESSAKTPAETKSKDKDKGKGIMVEDPKPMKKNQQVKLDEAYARKLHEELNQDIN